MENENIESGEVAAKQNPEGDGAKQATGGKGIIMCVNADIGKVYDNARLQQLYLAMMEGLIRNILPVIVGECRKVADGLDNATREVAMEAMFKEGARDAIAKEGDEA